MSYWERVGQGVGQGLVCAAGNAAAHHPHDRVINIDGISLLIREIVHDCWGHEISLTVLNSPNGEMNGFCTGIHQGHHARFARGECMAVLEYEVHRTYRS